MEPPAVRLKPRSRIISGRTTPRVNEYENCELGFTAGSGWTLLQYPESLSLGAKRVLDLVWLFLLLLPLGYWMRPDVRTMSSGVIVIATLLLVPAVTELTVTPLSEWLAAATGLGIGLALRSLVGGLGQSYGFVPTQ